MPHYRRYFVPGATYFFTAVTHERRPILTTEIGRDILRRSIRKVQKKRPFEIVAIVLLSEHIHTVWTLPPGDPDFSIRWAQIKESFTRLRLASDGLEGSVATSRTLHRERGVWQRRFWEHLCRDEADLKRCVDYLHWNPVKHGLVRSVREYPWSSFHRFVRAGEYDLEWGRTDPCPEALSAAGE